MKKGCGKAFLKEEGIIIEGRWYCSEDCSPSQEELLMEEQRMLKRIAKEDGLSQKDIDEEEEKEEDNLEHNRDDEEDDVFDLSVNMSNKKEVLTLAELEEKYKNFNKVAENAQSKEHDLEDSLN